MFRVSPLQFEQINLTNLFSPEKNRDPVYQEMAREFVCPPLIPGVVIAGEAPDIIILLPDTTNGERSFLEEEKVICCGRSGRALPQATPMDISKGMGDLAKRLFNPVFVKRLWEEHEHKRRDNSHKLLNLITAGSGLTGSRVEL